ncbi:hypothetical protein chiPu_0001514 [Chiloscyllium punctatum]|uniref:Uncharacterized protein n=1 Tax=Chiloscyllium punctatum TaxID=137246 RepID=A0A401RY89_CHIPU|nr:hypothetical protein [Chiloscyllium punctatum]
MVTGTPGVVGMGHRCHIEQIPLFLQKEVKKKHTPTQLSVTCIQWLLVNTVRSSGDLIFLTSDLQHQGFLNYEHA